MDRKGLGLVVGVVTAVLFSAWIWSRERAADPAPRSGVEARDSEVVHEQASDARDEDSGAREEAKRVVVDPAEDPGELEPSHRIVGRVVDERRRPVAGARVVLEGAAEGLSEVLSDADGGFECLALLDADSPGTRDSLVVRDARDRAAVSEVSLPPARSGEVLEVQVGTLVLLPAGELVVRVQHAGAPVADALVKVGLGHARMAGGEGRTDERGELRLEALPLGVVYLEAAFEDQRGHTRVFLPQEQSATIELEPTGGVDVLVVDARSGLGVAGAELRGRRDYRVPAALPSDPQRTMSGEYYSRSALSDEAPTTDAEGRARIEGLASGVRYTLAVRAPGYEPFPQRPASGARLEPGGELVRVELEPYSTRRVSWQVVAGEVPVPPDGAAIELRHRAGSYSRGNEPPLPAPGRMQGTVLVIDGVTGGASLIGQAPDGSLALLWAAADSDLGAETSFRRPRRIEVVVRDEAGEPLPGASVQARNQGNNALGEAVTTDAEGRALLENLFGGLAEVYVSAPGRSGSRGSNMGSVDLEQGDGRLDVTLSTPERLRARLALRIDGQPRLPARFQLRGSGAVEIVEELPERGELLLELERGEDEAPLVVYLDAVGFATATAQFEAARAVEEPSATIELVRTAVLVARVTLPAEDYVSIMPQRFDEARGAWGQARELHVFNGQSFANGPDGSFVFSGLTPGRWRVLDERSGVASSEATVLPGDREVSVELDLASIEWVSGRVQLDDPAELARVRVRVVDPEAEPVVEWRPGSEPPEGAWPRDGEFRVRVPGDHEVSLQAWHPWLVPDPEAGSLVLRGGREGVVLKLVEGDQLRLPAPQLDPRSSALRVARYADASEADGPPLEWHHAVLVDGVLRCALPRGRWTLWIETGRDFAPLVLPGVEIEGISELPAAEFTPGSTLRVRILAAEGGDAPRVYVRAERLGVPVYDRSINSNGEEVVLVPGLGAGRYRVSMSAIMEMRGLPDQEIEVDGLTDAELELDLR